MFHFPGQDAVDKLRFRTDRAFDGRDVPEALEGVFAQRIEWAGARLPPRARSPRATGGSRLPKPSVECAERDLGKGFFDPAPLLAAEFDRIMPSEMTDIVACVGAAASRHPRS